MDLYILDRAHSVADMTLPVLGGLLMFCATSLLLQRLMISQKICCKREACKANKYLKSPLALKLRKRGTRHKGKHNARRTSSSSSVSSPPELAAGTVEEFLSAFPAAAVRGPADDERDVPGSATSDGVVVGHVVAEGPFPGGPVLTSWQSRVDGSWSRPGPRAKPIPSGGHDGSPSFEVDAGEDLGVTSERAAI